MGLIANTNKIWLTVSRGSFVLRVPEGTPKAKKRINKNGDEVWESTYPALEGNITNVYIRETEYGDMLVFSVKDNEGDLYGFSIPITSNYAKHIVNYIVNVDFSKPVKFVAWQKKNKKDPTKTSVGITLYQDDKKVEPHFFVYDKETDKTIYKNGFPEFKGKFNKTKYQSYKLEVADFVRNVFEEQIIPLFELKDEPDTENEEVDDDMGF